MAAVTKKIKEGFECRRKSKVIWRI